jgi:hypothetical protein
MSMKETPKSLIEISENRRKYLRWSIPSLVLAMIAGIFTIASSIAQKRVIPRYEKVVAEYLEAMTDSACLWNENDMRRAEIAVKRLVVENPNSAQRILQSAKVELASYDKIQSTIASQADGHPEKIAKWNELAIHAKSRAIQSMQRAAKLDGADALEARHWLLDWSFRNMRDRSSELGVVSPASIQQCEELVAMGVPANILLTDMMIHRTLRFPECDEWTEIRASIQRASHLLDKERHSSLEINASRVEISAVLEPTRARAEAIKFVSESVRDPRSSHLDWRGFDAIFRLRLHMGNPSEAFDFAWKSLPELPASEREVFRWNAAASALRSMVVQLHHDEPQRKRSAAMLFGFALRFAPDSPQMIRAINAILNDHLEPEREEWMKVVTAECDSGVSDWIAWLRFWRARVAESDVAESDVADSSGIPVLDSSLIPGAIVAIRLIRQRGIVDHAVQMRMLDTLLPANPSNPDLRRIRDELAKSLGG